MHGESKISVGSIVYTVPDDCSYRTDFCCFPLALANICPWPLVQFFQISVKKSELKTTHNSYRDCRVHFFRQPFSKYLYTGSIGKSVADNPERYCGWFAFKMMARGAMDVCSRVLKQIKQQKSKLRQLQCREQRIDRIPYSYLGLSRAHIFRQPLSK